MTAPPTWPVAAGSLALGFAVAEVTGVRALGGVVLVLGAAWCALRWRERVGQGRTAGLLAVYLAAFVLSHVLGAAIGAWPAVAIVSVVVGCATFLAADAPHRSPAVA